MDEQGPAHKKNFYMKLQLGEKEEYSASGPSIKKAQHAAASIALEKTEYKHPPPKVPRNYAPPSFLPKEEIEGKQSKFYNEAKFMIKIWTHQMLVKIKKYSKEGLE